MIIRRQSIWATLLMWSLASYQSVATGQPVAQGIQTPQGKLRVVDSRRLTVGDRFIPEFGSAFNLAIKKSFVYANQTDALIETRSRAAQAKCPTIYQWLTITKGKMVASSTFGACSDEVKITSGKTGVSVEMPKPDSSTRGVVRYDYDGITLSYTESASGWVGKTKFLSRSTPISPQALQLEIPSAPHASANTMPGEACTGYACR